MREFTSVRVRNHATLLGAFVDTVDVRIEKITSMCNSILKRFIHSRIDQVAYLSPGDGLAKLSFDHSCPKRMTSMAEDSGEV